MPTRCEHVAEHGKSRPEEVRLFNLGVPPNRRASQTPCSLPPSSADGSAAARGGAGGGAGAFPPSAVGNGHSSTHRSEDVGRRSFQRLWLSLAPFSHRPPRSPAAGTALA
ncbi:scrapie-responsive protein 1 isoform X2 [Apus apus]|uniref:scrapie-responsive protein 1 isoform X2 n=1 Tax=Apus apus TaxID=8895 RepID=UPI0021F82925|nr:scrapie-responsive protein 1 isoform X2 [Apus apus]